MSQTCGDYTTNKGVEDAVDDIVHDVSFVVVVSMSEVGEGEDAGVFFVPWTEDRNKKTGEEEVNSPS
jgi:hypothetical protein